VVHLKIYTNPLHEENRKRKEKNQRKIREKKQQI
jgi:hypothetical protein